jgi:YVTN family beta-propeller protein
MMAVEPPAGEPGPDAFGVLGPLEVLRYGRPLPLGGPRQRAVLALLLVEVNRAVSMDRLAEDVWDGHPPEGWANTLQTYVFHLRQTLEPGRARGAAAGVLVTSGRGYVLRVGREQLDAAVFEDGFTAGRAALEAGRYAEAAQKLRTALGLWRGPVLADLADYAFTRPEAARLEELRLAALEARIDADLALGRHDALTAELEKLAGEHLLRERLHAQLMLALYRCGRQADALAAYRRARDLLAGELGLDPGEPLRRLHASILAHDPALDWRGIRQMPTEAHPASAGAPATLRAPERPGLPTAGGGRERDWARRHARRLLAAGSALAVAAAVSIVVVARPWAGEPTGLPANSVGLIDPAGGRVGAPVTVGSPAGLAYGDGSVWSVDGTAGAVSQINPVTHAVVQRIPVGAEPSAVTVTRGGNVWVANSGDGTVSQINAAAGKVVQTIGVGNVPAAIAGGPSGVWVANEGDDTVSQINPATGAKTRTVQVGGRPDGIAVGPRAVWVANSQDGTVTRIDPATGQSTGPFFVGAGPAGIAVTPTAVWVANSLDLSVMKIDPATGRVTATIGVGDGPSTIAAAKDGVWVSDEFNATLDHIDPHANRVDRVIPVESSPQSIAVAPSGGVWVAARPFAAASHRGGTLTEVSPYLPQREPALAYDVVDGPPLATVYDGLVALRKANGALGFTLVPDLARTLPRPADGGRTYTFTLRQGIRYSNGMRVRASDFRRGIQRQLSFGVNPGYYEGILGGRACHQHPHQCDLSAGIVTNDAARTVTFHLGRADPDFVYKLALLLAVPAPPGAPSHAINRAPFLPGTGPYIISQYRPNASLILTRNPYFRQWSYAAQPAGYPNVIHIKQLADPRKQQSAVAAGTADLVDITLNGQPYHPLAVQYPTRVYPGVKIATSYMFLNTRQPPFTSLKARQAVNYAIDRGRIIRLLHGSGSQETVTCQILPAGLPGYQRYCPYTAGPKDGFWHGPDLSKARRLAKQSGTTNVPVTVWNIASNGGKRVGAYLAQLLRLLGYRAAVRNVSAAQWYTTVTNPHHKIQMGAITAWLADFPTASDYFLPVLTCRSLSDDPAGTLNIAEYCSPRVDKLASKAQTAQLTDPAAARRLWARVDRIVTNQAPWVPISNTSPTIFASARVGNYQESPYYGPLLDQIWVR